MQTQITPAAVIKTHVDEVVGDVDEGDVVPFDVERRHVGAVVVPEQVAAAVPKEFAWEVGVRRAAARRPQVDFDQRPQPRPPVALVQQQLDRVLRRQPQFHSAAAVGAGQRRPRHVEHVHAQVVAERREVAVVAQLVACWGHNNAFFCES